MGSSWADNGYFRVYMGQLQLKMESWDNFYASVNTSCKAKITPYFFSSLSTALGNSFKTGEEAYINANHTVSSNTSLPSSKTLNLYGDLTVSFGTFTVNSNATVKANAGKEINVSGTGTLNAKSGATFTKLGGSYWSGIDILSSGVLDVDGAITIENAVCGLDIGNAGGLVNGSNVITINNCSSEAVYVNSCGPVVDYIICNNNSASFNPNGITINGSSANPNVQFVTVRNSDYGIEVSSSSTSATVDYCDIQSNNLNHSIKVNSYCRICLEGPGLNGNNNIDPGGSFKAVHNPSTGSIYAQNNWWGVNPPSDTLFEYAANVDYDNHKTGPVGAAGAEKAARTFREIALFEKAQIYEADGDHMLALDTYYQALAIETDHYIRKFILTAILRIQDKFDRDYGKLKTLIENEMSVSKGWYHASLDFVLSDILLREGKYEQAARDFEVKSA